MTAFFGGLTLVPLILIFCDGEQVATAPAVIPALLMFCLLTGFGVVYSAKYVPMRRDVHFSHESVCITNAYLFGRSETRVGIEELVGIEFGFASPSEAIFQFAHVRLRLKDGRSVPLAHMDSPMYAWQGVAAFDALGSMFERLGKAELLHPDQRFIRHYESCHVKKG